MATYLYCVLSEPRDVPGALAGIDGAPVRPMGSAGLIAWVSEVAVVPVTPTVERLKAHDAVCGAALHAGETPLPVRFGRTFADREAALDAIAARRHALAQRLAHIAGCVELRVVVSRPPVARGAGRAEFREARPREVPEGDVGPGTAFLRERVRLRHDEAARERSCEAIRQRIVAGAEVRIVDWQPCETRRGLAYFPLLVPRTDFDRCRTLIAAIVPSAEQALSVLGPFPPYSFAGDA